MQWSDQLLMEQPDFIQKWISRFGSLWDPMRYPYEPHIPVIAIVMYQNTEKNSILNPEELRRPDTIDFHSITDNHSQRHFICHNSSTFEYRTFQGNHFNSSGPIVPSGDILCLNGC